MSLNQLNTSLLAQVQTWTQNILVVPCHLEQVIIVADKGVESDAFVCACDLQRGGGISCKWQRILGKMHM